MQQWLTNDRKMMVTFSQDKKDDPRWKVKKPLSLSLSLSHILSFLSPFNRQTRADSHGSRSRSCPTNRLVPFVSQSAHKTLRASDLKWVWTMVFAMLVRLRRRLGSVRWFIIFKRLDFAGSSLRCLWIRMKDASVFRTWRSTIQDNERHR